MAEQNLNMKLPCIFATSGLSAISLAYCVDVHVYVLVSNSTYEKPMQPQTKTETATEAIADAAAEAAVEAAALWPQCFSCVRRAIAFIFILHAVRERNCWEIRCVIS